MIAPGGSKILESFSFAFTPDTLAADVDVIFGYADILLNVAGSDRGRFPARYAEWVNEPISTPEGDSPCFWRVRLNVPIAAGDEVRAFFVFPGEMAARLQSHEITFLVAVQFGGPVDPAPAAGPRIVPPYLLFPRGSNN